MPKTVQNKIGEVHLRGIKVHKFTVDVTPPYAGEIAWGLKDLFKSDDAFKWHGKELSANPQQDPVTEKRVAAAGKARAFLVTKCAEGSAPRCTYEPAWKMMVANAQISVEVAIVDEAGQLTWTEAGCQTAFKAGASTLMSEFTAFRG